MPYPYRDVSSDSPEILRSTVTWSQYCIFSNNLSWNSHIQYNFLMSIFTELESTQIWTKQSASPLDIYM